jgi:hypothetical protein
MPVSELPQPPSVSPPPAEGLDFGALISQYAPYLLGALVIFIIIYVIYKILKGKKELKDYNAETYKNLMKQLKAIKLNKGFGSLSFSFAFIVLAFALGMWLFAGSTLWIFITMAFAFLVSKTITVSFSSFFEVENYIYDRDLNKRFVIESLPLTLGDGVKLYLVSTPPKAFFFQKYQILILPAQKDYKFKYLDKEGKTYTLTGSIPNFDKVIEKTSRNDFIINCAGFELKNFYYFPVLKVEGNSFFSFREVAFQVNKALSNEMMVYDLLPEHQKNIIGAVSANANIRVANKTKDNLNVDDSQPEQPLRW